MDKNADINFPNEYGCMPLYIAANEKHNKVVRALLKRGADPLLSNCDNKTLDKKLTEDAIMLAIILGVGTFIIASVVAAIVVTSAYFIGVSLSVSAMAGIAVAAVVMGLVAGVGIIYEVSKPCDELKDAIAREMSKLSKTTGDDNTPNYNLENSKTDSLASEESLVK